MRDEDKPFVCTRGRWAFNIRPRTAWGWVLMAMWVLPLIGSAALLEWLLGRWQGPYVAPAVIFSHVAFTIGWIVLMIRWMMPRSVVIRAGERSQDGRN